ncbi:MAG: hypothetical protein ACRDIB_17480 [Ardenticatenaceae bacterium]
MIASRRADERGFDNIQRRSLIVGTVGVVLLIVGALFSLEQVFRSYLLGYMFWVGIALGSLAIAALHQLTGGRWGMVMRRLLEAGALTLPVMALLFVPLAFGLPAIYEWARPEAVAGDELLQHKQVWLNIPFFLIRTAIYFAVWIVVAYFLTNWSLELDDLDDPQKARRLRVFSAVGLLLMVLTVTFASYDWLMSLEPHWFSSIFGAVVGVGFVIAAFTLTIITVVLLADRRPLSEVLSPLIFNDFGSLLLTFIMIWAYLMLSQFLIIWAANLPEEVTWYLHRSEGGWQWIGWALALFHFALPFVFLLSATIRQNPRTLAGLAAFVLFMHFVELFWLIKPTFAPEGLRIHWLDIVALVGLGGVWVALFIWQLKQRPLVPAPDIVHLREPAEH